MHLFSFLKQIITYILYHRKIYKQFFFWLYQQMKEGKMKIKQILEEVNWETVSNYDPEHNKKGIDYRVDGQSVSEDIFRKEQRKICFWTTQRISKIENEVIYNGPEPPILSNEKKKVTTQYLPLPFY